MSSSERRNMQKTLRSFNRYEIKYLVPVTEPQAFDLLPVEPQLAGVVVDTPHAVARGVAVRVAKILPTIEERLDRDPYSDTTGYGVWSVYYDTRQLRFYWEKIEGLRFRRKLRVRHYGDRFGVTEDTPVFVEIKQRVNRVTPETPHPAALSGGVAAVRGPGAA
jgi:hypothetical protein